MNERERIIATIAFEAFADDETRDTLKEFEKYIDVISPSEYDQICDDLKELLHEFSEINKSRTFTMKKRMMLQK